MRRRCVLVLCALVASAGVFASPSTAASPVQHAITVLTTDGDFVPTINVPNAGPLFFARVCPAQAPGVPCPSSAPAGGFNNGTVYFTFDPDVPHQVTVFGYYQQFVETHLLPTGNTTPVVLLTSMGPAATLTGVVLRDGAPNTFGKGILVCPVSMLPCGPVANGGTGAPLGTIPQSANPSGSYSVHLNSLFAYDLRAAILDPPMTGDQLFSERFTWDPATDPPTHDFNIVTFGIRYSGNVEREGFETFPPNTVGVGACPTGTPYGAGCDPKFSYADAEGDFVLRLPTGTWNVAGFIFIDGSPVISTNVLVGEVAPSGFLEARSLPDFSVDRELPAGSTPTSVAVSDLSFTTGGNELSNVAAVPTSTVNTPIPDAVLAPYGAVSFTSTVPGCDPDDVPAVGGTATITVALPADARPTGWYKLVAGTWQPFAGASIDPSTPNVVDITIVDGGDGDADGIVNCFVTDPAVADIAPFSGLLDPIRPIGVTTMQRGRTVPLRWQVTDAEGAPITDPAHVESLTFDPAGTAGPIDLLASGALKYGGDGLWQLNWRAPGSKGSGVLTLDVVGHDPDLAPITLK